MSILKKPEYLGDYSADDYSGDDYQTKAKQVVYVDFDGASTSYNGELLTIEHLTVEHSGLSPERIEYIVETLNTLYENVTFTVELPASGEYSTVFVGKTDAFAFLGEIYGISETVDSGNRSNSDNAFVLLDAASSNDLFVSVIDHEVGHLLGESHGGEGIEAYLAEAASTKLTTDADVVNPDDGVISLREAITVYYAAGVSNGLCTITFDPSLDGVPLAGSGGLFYQVYSNTLIQGNGSSKSIVGHAAVDENDDYSNNVLVVGSNHTLTLRDVTYYNLRGGGDATINISGGAVAIGLMTGDNTHVNVYSGGVVSSFYTANNETYNVFDGGIVSGGQLNSTTRMTVGSGGIAKSVIIDNNAKAVIEGGAVTSDMQLYGVMEVSGGATVSNTFMARNGIMYLSSGAVVDGGYYTDNAVQYYASGASMTGWQNFNGSASQYVADGATVDFTGVFGDNAAQFVGAGARVKGVTFLGSASQHVESGAVTENCTFNDNTTQLLDSGATATKTIINGGTQVVRNGATAIDTEVNNGGVMSVHDGGKIQGATSVGGQLIVDGEVDANGGSLIFMLESNKPSDPVLVTDLDNLINVSSYEVKVNPDISSLGEYVLATGASDFNTTITLSDWGWVHGSLTVNGEAVVSQRTGIAYFLKLDDAGNLTLLVRVAEDPSNRITMFSDTTYLYDDTYSFREAMTTYAKSSDETVDVTFAAAGEFMVDSDLVVTHSNIILSGLGAANTVIGGSSGQIIISSGGGVTFDSATVNDLAVRNGSAIFSGGAIANNMSAEAGAGESAVIDLHCYASGGRVGLNGKVNVLTGGFLTDFYMGHENAGTVAVSSGGIVSGGYVGGANFDLQVYDGGLVNALNMNQGNASAFSGGLIQNGWFYTSATLNVLAGGSSFYLTFGDTAGHTVAGTAETTDLKQSAGQTVLAGGVTSNLRIYDNASASIKAGGSAKGNVLVGNYLELEDGAVTTDAIVTLDLSDRQTSASYMVNRADLLTNGIDTITNYASLAQGSYKLAGSAANLTAAIASGDSMEIGGQFTYTASTRYSGMANGSNRYALVLNADNTLVLVIHDRYQLLGNGNAEYIAEDVSYTDMRSGSSSGIYARLISGQSYAGMVYGGGSLAAVAGKVTLDIAAALTTHLYAGGYGKSVGSTELNFQAGMASTSYVYAGGRNAGVTAGTVINATGGIAYQLFGGGRADTAGATASAASAVLNLQNGFSNTQSNAYTYGGGHVTAGGAQSTVGEVTVNVTGASLAYLHGGGYATNGTASVEKVNITVSSGGFSGYIYSGGRANGANATSTVDEVSLTISGGTFSHVFGGGYATNGGTSSVGKVDILVTGGTFTGSIYGGGQGNSKTPGNATVLGDINITIDVSDKVVSFRDDNGVMVGGNTVGATILGNTTLTLTGSGSNLQTSGGKFTGWLSSAADFGVDLSKTHTLRFADFTDLDFRAKISSSSFNHISAGGNTAISITNGANWASGCDFSFDLTGRNTSLNNTAFIKQEKGTLGITGESLFQIGFSSANLTGDSGSILLLDGNDGINWQFGTECVELNFGGQTAKGTFNGGSINLGGYSFNLVYDRPDGTFHLAWSLSEESLFRSSQQGILA